MYLHVWIALGSWHPATLRLQVHSYTVLLCVCVMCFVAALATAAVSAAGAVLR